MANKREGISVFLSYVLGLAWSIVLVYCVVGELRLSVIALAGALFVTGAIVLVIKRIGGRIYGSKNPVQNRRRGDISCMSPDWEHP